MYLNMTEDLTWQKKTGGKNLIDDDSDTQKHDKCDGGGGGGGDNMSSNVSMSNQKEFYASLFDQVKAIFLVQVYGYGVVQ